MRFKGADQARKQAEELSGNLAKTMQGFTSLLGTLKGQLTAEEKADFSSYKNTPEGRKQSEVFDKIRAGVDEVMNNLPKQ